MFGGEDYPKPNFIHPTATIDEDVEMGEGNYIGPYCYITGETSIGDNNRFEAYCSIGTHPEHTDFKDKKGKLWVGDNNWFREFVTVNASTVEVTTLMDNITLLKGSHVGHDSMLESHVTLSCNAVIGGHSHLFEGCNFGLGAVCHQRSVIGHYSMIGMNSTVTKSSLVKPGGIYVGSPVRQTGENIIGMERFKITPLQLTKAIAEFNHKCSQG